ncbi:MAG: formate dehydrogenase subunit gamma [Betaproteobacteria bacterium]|nr:formate dehydrogenase subunit gamma [Betaproteobacteria bacterium]
MNTRSGLVSLAIVLCAVWLPGTTAAQLVQPAEQDSQAKRQAEQPGNNAPMWRDVRAGEPNYTSVKGPETGVLIQPQARFFGQDTMTTAGEAWRKYRNGPVTFYGGLFILVMAGLIAAFYFWKGEVRLPERPSGRLMKRFSTLERCAHWSMAISFCVLGVSGLVMFFGKYILLPVIGHTLFSWLTMLMKNLHNFVGPLFMLSVILAVIVFVRYNLPAKDDLKWIVKAGGLVSGEHVPSGRFNAGEKGWFWLGAVVLGTLMSVTGLIMLFPNFEQVRSTMQQANIVHGIGSMIMVGLSFAHIYIGTLGMEGAFQGMRTGYSDEVWVKEHHETWYNDVKSGKAAGSERAPAAQLQH